MSLDTLPNQTKQKLSNKFMCEQEKTLSHAYLRLNNELNNRFLDPIESNGRALLMYDILDAKPQLLCSLDLAQRGGNSRFTQ